ncbi:histone acetyltransferase MCC1 isoform X1 [Dioscorea cayenensis subsp. rotundata]|uniref:N-alpha-acetyltransferase 60 n=1 Tax=Dioscorea cayennensis subsp. rotundata TaxID=55577 RepID=A0AB40CMM7_DIOCR|nr:histone acetyltransferase MCC1 isoform X1 [Dioscorea cayenensis subsp. rotundata]XP_039141157.1 histone acetyltransferase MCC1 isoform X1 [Dioscorea cayenensis subsp. rotundata]
MLEQPMLDVQATYVPSVIYRPILPSDLDVLEQIHAKLFPIRYEREFFLNVVNGHGIVSWAAVDIGLNSQSDELIGFVTTRVIAAHDSEIEDLLTSDASRKDATLVYILTLGVVERYRNHGIAGSLVREVTKYASSMTNCRAVYLHVIAYNQPAINFYQKMQFKLIRKLHKFYYIKGRHYDAYLFVYYVNGGRSPCSPLLQWYAHPFPYAETSCQRLRRTLRACLSFLLQSYGKKPKRRALGGQSVKKAAPFYSLRIRESLVRTTQYANACDKAAISK